MGLISRLRRITRGRIEAFLDAMEDPGAVVPILIDELAGQVKAAANAEAKSLTAVKSHQRKLDEATGRVARMQKGAALALQSGQEDLARQAIALELQAEKDQAACRDAVETAQKAYAEARGVRAQLAGELESLRARKNELIGRARQAKQATSSAGTAGSSAKAAATGRRLLDEVARMEEKIQTSELQTEAGQEISGMLADELSPRRIEQLLRDQEVQRRLDELKKQLDGQAD